MGKVFLISFFGLLDLFVLLLLIKWLFQTPTKFIKALWQVGRSPFFNLILKDRQNDPIAGYKVGLMLIIVGLLVWGEQSLFN
jgi:hypothetical protein